MGYSLYIFRIYKPHKEEVRDLTAFQVDSETKKALIVLGLKDKMIKIAGKFFIGIEEVDISGYHRRYKQDYYSDYWNPEIRNPSIRLNWDWILSKERLIEIKEKYVHKELQDLFQEYIIDLHKDGETIAIRI